MGDHVIPGDLVLLPGYDGYVRLRSITADYLDHKSNHFTLTVTHEEDEEIYVSIRNTENLPLRLSFDDLTRLPTIIFSLACLLRPKDSP